MRMPSAVWRGSVNFSVGGVTRPPRGMVLHTCEGYYEGTIAWCNNPVSKVSYHFVVAKDGRIAQLVDLKDKAWCQSGGNSEWVGVGFEGFGGRGETLTDSQVHGGASIYAWLNQSYGIPFNTTDDIHNGRGLIYHGAGGTAWGGHFSCPGSQIVAQRQLMLERAAVKAGVVAPVRPVPPTGGVLVELYAYAKALGRSFMNGPILKQGVSGVAVRDLQFALVAGFGQQIAVDSSFGAATTTAVKNVQRQFHQPIDGIVGPKTRAIIAYVLAMKFP